MVYYVGVGDSLVILGQVEDDEGSVPDAEYLVELELADEVVGALEFLALKVAREDALTTSCWSPSLMGPICLTTALLTSTMRPIARIDEPGA